MKNSILASLDDSGRTLEDVIEVINGMKKTFGEGHEPETIVVAEMDSISQELSFFDPEDYEDDYEFEGELDCATHIGVIFKETSREDEAKEKVLETMRKVKNGNIVIACIPELPSSEWLRGEVVWKNYQTIKIKDENGTVPINVGGIESLHIVPKWAVEGTKVKMVDCIEARAHDKKGDNEWTIRHKADLMQANSQLVVWLEGYAGGFDVECLAPIDE